MKIFQTLVLMMMAIVRHWFFFSWKNNDEYLSIVTFFHVVYSKPSNLSIVGKKHACYSYWHQLCHHCH
jgi:hypothetical protein